MQPHMRLYSFSYAVSHNLIYYWPVAQHVTRREIGHMCAFSDSVKPSIRDSTPLMQLHMDLCSFSYAGVIQSDVLQAIINSSVEILYT
jgi:hypothetical protein